MLKPGLSYFNMEICSRKLKGTYIIARQLHVQTYLCDSCNPSTRRRDTGKRKTFVLRFQRVRP